MAELFKAKVKETGEVLTVYKLNNSNYYDYDNMGADMPPKAVKANKKEFSRDEVSILKR